MKKNVFWNMKKNVFWNAAIGGGVFAGLLMILLEMIMNPLFLGASMWSPVRMMGAILLGSEVLPPPATFDLGIFMAAMAVHFPLSIIFTIIIGAIVKNMDTAKGVLVGVIIGLAIYLINFYLFTAIFPWFANARNWVQIVIHMVFGLSAAWSFILIYGKQQKTITT